MAPSRKLTSELRWLLSRCGNLAGQIAAECNGDVALRVMLGGAQNFVQGLDTYFEHQQIKECVPDEVNKLCEQRADEFFNGPEIAALLAAQKPVEDAEAFEARVQAAVADRVAALKQREAEVAEWEEVVASDFAAVTAEKAALKELRSKLEQERDSFGAQVQLFVSHKISGDTEAAAKLGKAVELAKLPETPDVPTFELYSNGIAWEEMYHLIKISGTPKKLLATLDRLERERADVPNRGHSTEVLPFTKIKKSLVPKLGNMQHAKKRVKDYHRDAQSGNR